MRITKNEGPAFGVKAPLRGPDADASDDLPDGNFVLRPLLQSNMMSVLAMEKQFQLKLPSQTLEYWRLGPEKLRPPIPPESGRAGHTCQASPGRRPARELSA